MPLIVNPYGGPHAQMVTGKWSAEERLFDQVLVQSGFAVLHVDNRGMGAEAVILPRRPIMTLDRYSWATRSRRLTKRFAPIPNLTPSGSAGGAGVGAAPSPSMP